MKHKYTIAVFLLYYIFSLPFGEGWGEVSAQQLSPRYVRMSRIVTFSNPVADTVVTFEAARATGIRGEMVGVANGECNQGGPLTSIGGHEDLIPYIYRLDSTGKFIFLKSLKIPSTGISKYHRFAKVIPYKDNLYIIGSVDDNELSYYGYHDGHALNMIIIKTDSVGNIVWKNKLGFTSTEEFVQAETVSSDGGLVFAGTTFRFGPTSIPADPVESKYRFFVTKYNADGTIKFNKTFKITRPVELNINDTAGVPITIASIVETPDKGYLISANPARDLSSFPGTLYPGGPYLIKLDANGNRVWEKMGLYDNTVYRYNAIGGVLISHPAGGYLMVGGTGGAKWDSTGLESISGRHYNSFGGGGITKIAESGEVEWTKVLRRDFNADTTGWYGSNARDILFSAATISTANGTATGFLLKGTIRYPNDASTGSRSNNFQTAIIKTDLNGNVKWGRQYYTGLLPNTIIDPYPTILEEPGGSIVVNSFASPEPDITIFPPPSKGILRLNSKGYLGDALCSMTSKIAVHNELPPVAYDETQFVFETTPALTGTLSPGGTFNKKTPLTTSATCVNPLTADFTYRISCSDSGSTVKFTNTSTAGSWFKYNFGDLPAGTKNISESSSPQHLYSIAGTYTVTLTVWDGDSTKMNMAQKTIEIKPRRYVKLLSGNTTICSGSSINITATMNSGSFAPECIGCRYYVKLDGNNYFSDPDPYTSYTNDSTIFNTKSLNTSMRLFLMTNGNTCIASDTIVVSVLPSVHVSVRGENTTYCKGDSALLIASGSNTYLWNPGGSTNDSLKVYPGSTSSYTVSSGKTKVCGTDSAIIKVTVNPIPSVDAGADQTIFPEKQTRLLASGGTNYLWTPAAGLSATNIADPVASPLITTTYTVNVTDANGCVNLDDITINLKFCGVDLFVPNAFSPNADNENDVFYVKTLNNNCIQSFELKIFDRWGNKVFESNDINNGWNGAYKGKTMDSGVFAYFLNAVLEGGEIVTQKGNITLIR